jgi:uncharacterized protein (TIGR02217 family)
MSITVFSDVILPNNVLAAGVRGKQIRRNTRVTSQSGKMQINVDWSRTRREYELGTVPMSISAWQTLEGLHEVTEGGAYGFLMQDPKDFTVLITEGVASLVTGTTYQLKKRYTAAGSSRTKDRTITRPLAAGLTLLTSGVPVASYTLDSTTGRVVIPSAPSAATLTWSGKFYVPVHFLSDEIDWELAVAGPADARMLTGPSVVLQEVME